MSIKKIRIRNYRSHKDTTLELHEGVNVIAGATNQGKSALYQAVEWACLNNIRGIGYRPTTYDVDNNEYSVCILEFDNNSLTLRRRNESNNEYGFITSENMLPPIILRSFGNTIPEEIKVITHMDAINFNGQEDGRFLLGRNTSASEVARLLNEYVGLEIIDIVQDNAKTNVNRYAGLLNTATEQLATTNTELEALSWVPEAEALFAEMDSLIERQRILTSNIEIANNLTQQVNELVECIADNTFWLQVSMETENLQQIILEYKTLTNEIRTVKDLQAQVGVIDSRIEQNLSRYTTLEYDLGMVLDGLEVCPIFEVPCCLPLGQQQ